MILSGGNVDLGVLPSLVRRHETRAVGAIMFARIDDRPGALASLLTLVAERGANLIEVEHVREGVDLHVRETGVQIVLEVRARARRRGADGGRGCRLRGGGHVRPLSAPLSDRLGSDHMLEVERLAG